jgi:hypothetical protein
MKFQLDKFILNLAQALSPIVALKDARMSISTVCVSKVTEFFGKVFPL